MPDFILELPDYQKIYNSLNIEEIHTFCLFKAGVGAYLYPSSQPPTFLDKGIQ